MLPASRSPRPRAPRRAPQVRRAGLATAAGALALTLGATLGVAAAGPAASAAPGSGAGASGADRGGDGQRRAPLRRTGGAPGDLSQRLVQGRDLPQTSDGEPGLVAPEAFTARAARARTITNTVTEQYTVVPGLSFARFERLDSVRGNVRGQLLTLDIGAPGLSLDYANPRKVAKTATMATLISKEQGLAAINGDFFDIGDTGASLGIGVDRQEGVVKGPLTGWNAAFYVDAAGVPQVGGLQTEVKIKQRKRWKVAGLNAPSVPADSIGAYDERWGALKGYRVTDDSSKRVRMVQIKGGRVVSNRTSIPRYTKIKGKVLIGRGAGADKLSRLRVGFRSGFKTAVTGNPQVAITGDRPILLGGIRQVINDVEMHPRTAIGIDRDTNRILMLVVDGRQSFSRGLTMVELAQLMTELGADDALNLDGGGSSTMMAPDAAGVIGVRNSPSDGPGTLRKVANGLVLDYTPDPTAVATTPPPVFPVPVVPTPTPNPTPTPSVPPVP